MIFTVKAKAAASSGLPQLVALGGCGPSETIEQPHLKLPREAVAKREIHTPAVQISGDAAAWVVTAPMLVPECSQPGSGDAVVFGLM